MQNVLVENLLIILNILIILAELNILELVVEVVAALPAFGGFVRDITAAPARTLFAVSTLVVLRATTTTTVASTSRRLSALVKSSF
jgi:hypothetical protein